MALRIYAALATSVLVACGDDSGPEVVVRDARLGGAAPVVLGATADAVLWTAKTGTTTLAGGAALASLPATGSQLASSSGLVAHAGNHVLFADGGMISRVSLDGDVQRLTSGTPEALGGSSQDPPTIAWTSGAEVSWGIDDAQMTATLTRIDRCDHVRVTSDHVYVAADGASGRRLFRIEQRTGEITPITASSTWGMMFPGGSPVGATYRGRIAGADADAVLWLVEEMPSGRGIVVREPLQGEPTVLLQHLSGASGFFVTDDALYWQESDALLTAPLTGGAASIVATLPGPAGAVVDGYVYFTDGNSIARLPAE